MMAEHGPGWAILDEAGQEKKYVLVVRDPRDATVSLMHYHHDGADDANLAGSWLQHPAALRGYLGGVVSV